MGKPVFLYGSAAEVGAQQGTLQAIWLKERVERTLQQATRKENESLLRERAARFEGLVQQAAPHWVVEARAMAGAAGVEDWTIFALNALPANFWGSEYVAPPFSDALLESELVDIYDAQGIEPGLGGGDCTTYFALGAACISNETLFHKNRDERDEVQWLEIKQIEGYFRFVGGADIGNLGTAHTHTENFWVGANNTGSPVPAQEYQDCALSDAHVLRLLSESCRTLDDILPALENWIARGWVGGGGFNYGNIWLFADAERALIVEATSRRLAHQWYEDGDMEVRTNHFLFPEMQEYALPAHEGSLRRYERATELWLDQHGIAGISVCGEIGRDREGAPLAICRNISDELGSVTTSTATATISTHDDRRCQTHFRNCHPSYTPVVILTPLDSICDSELVSGAHNQRWRNYRQYA